MHPPSLPASSRFSFPGPSQPALIQRLSTGYIWLISHMVRVEVELIRRRIPVSMRYDQAHWA